MCVCMCARVVAERLALDFEGVSKSRLGKKKKSQNQSNHMREKKNEAFAV